MGSIRGEVFGNRVGCFVGSEELEEMILFVRGFKSVIGK